MPEEALSYGLRRDGGRIWMYVWVWLLLYLSFVSSVSTAFSLAFYVNQVSEHFCTSPCLSAVCWCGVTPQVTVCASCALSFS